MTQPTPTLTLDIRPAAGTSELVYHVLLGDAPVGANRTLPLRVVQDLAASYDALFTRWAVQAAEQAAEQAAQQQALGERLFADWLAPLWSEVQATLLPVAPWTLVVASPLAAVLNLPWELLRLPGTDALGGTLTASVRRLPLHPNHLPL